MSDGLGFGEHLSGEQTSGYFVFSLSDINMYKEEKLGRETRINK